MKNIMLITQSLTGGGAEKVVANLSKILSKNANVFIVTYSQNDHEYQFEGTRVNIDCLGGNVTFWKKIYNALFRIYKITILKRTLKIDYSLSFVPQTDYANVFSLGTNEKKIIEVSSNSSMAFTTFFARFFRKIVLKRASHIVCVSDGGKKDLIKNFKINPNKVSTIYNPTDVFQINKHVENPSKTLKEITNCEYIVAIGSFRKPKGHWHLIKAFSLLIDKFPNLKLVILGDGEYREKYNELISNLNISSDKIIMPGFLENPYPVLKKAKLFVFSSIYEGFGNVIIEAMACGVPVLSTDCNYGPREILYNDGIDRLPVNKIEMADYGCLVPHCGDDDIDVSSNINSKEQMLFEAMKKMLSDVDILHKYSRKGAERCEDFDSRIFINRWLDLFRNV